MVKTRGRLNLNWIPKEPNKCWDWRSTTWWATHWTSSCTVHYDGGWKVEWNFTGRSMLVNVEDFCLILCGIMTPIDYLSLPHSTLFFKILIAPNFSSLLTLNQVGRKLQKCHLITSPNRRLHPRTTGRCRLKAIPENVITNSLKSTRNSPESGSSLHLKHSLEIGGVHQSSSRESTWIRAQAAVCGGVLCRAVKCRSSALENLQNFGG